VFSDSMAVGSLGEMRMLTSLPCQPWLRPPS